MKKIFLTIWILIISHSVYAATHSYTLKTNYPTTYGAYSQLRLIPMDYTRTTPCKIGMLYFDVAGQLNMCQANLTGDGEWNPSILWGSTGSDVYLKDSINKRIGIGTTIPEFRLSLSNDGGILATGTFGSGVDLLSTGAGSKFIWSPKKAAFRAGTVSGHQWDDSYNPALFEWWHFSPYSVAVGYNTKTSSSYSQKHAAAFGYDTFALGFSSVAMGYQTYAGGTWDAGGAAFGYRTATDEYDADGAVAIGYESQAMDFYATAIGRECEANNMRSVAMGYQSVADGYASNAIGVQATTGTNATGSTAIGHQAKIWTGAENSIAIGYLASISMNREDAIAIGYNARTAGQYGLAIGRGVMASGDNSTCIGTGQTAFGDNSFAIGYNAFTYGVQSFALGRFVRTQTYGSFLFGQYNIVPTTNTLWSGTDPLFVIANGTSHTSRSNALTILKNGDVGIKTNAPTSRLHIMGIQEYTDNAAAVSAGLQAGDFYRTGDELRVVF